jgi:cell division protein ZapA
MNDKAPPSTLNVQILGKDYLISCPDGEEENLRMAARHLDKNMNEIKASGKIIGTERIAVMVALNFASDLLQLDQVQEQKMARAAQKVEFLTSKIEQILLDLKG